MEHGAYYVHKQLRTELKNYICSQYFGKTPILLQALSAQLDQEGVLYRKPFLESSPAYQTRPSGMSTAEIPDWMKKFFARLEEAALGVYPAPFCRLRPPALGRIFLSRRERDLEKPSAFCGRFLQRWRERQETVHRVGAFAAYVQ